MSYGPGITGAKQVTFASKNGRVFQGTIDGRAFTMSRAGRTPSLTFLDGQPEPTIVANPQLVTTVNGLAAEVNKSLSSCGTVVAVLDGIQTEVRNSAAHRMAAVATASPFGPRSGPRLGDNLAAPGIDWYEPAGEDHGSCLSCEDDCNKKYADATSNFGCWLSVVFSHPNRLGLLGCMHDRVQCPGRRLPPETV